MRLDQIRGTRFGRLARYVLDTYGDDYVSVEAAIVELLLETRQLAEDCGVDLARCQEPALNKPEVKDDE